MSKQSRYDYVTNHCKFGPSIEGRDEMAIKRTIASLLKLLHPVGEPSRHELEEYMAYAIEGRRRIKEQLNKRKHDDEYAKVNLSYIDTNGNEIIVWCPESKDAVATQYPERKRLPGAPELKPKVTKVEKKSEEPEEEKDEEIIVLSPLDDEGTKEDHYTILYGDTGYSYESIFGKYLPGCETIWIEDPYIRLPHQIQNLVRFCELAVKTESVKKINLVTGLDNDSQKAEVEEKLEMLQGSLRQNRIEFKWKFSPVIHDRVVKLDNGWVIKIGRGLDIYQRPETWFSVGSSDFDLRPCMETMADIYRDN